GLTFARFQQCSLRRAPCPAPLIQQGHSWVIFAGKRSFVFQVGLGYRHPSSTNEVSKFELAYVRRSWRPFGLHVQIGETIAGDKTDDRLGDDGGPNFAQPLSRVLLRCFAQHVDPQRISTGTKLLKDIFASVFNRTSHRLSRREAELIAPLD